MKSQIFKLLKGGQWIYVSVGKQFSMSISCSALLRTKALTFTLSFQGCLCSKLSWKTEMPPPSKSKELFCLLPRVVKTVSVPAANTG